MSTCYTADTSRRAAAYGRAMAAHFSKLRTEPNAYGQVGLAELFEMREECLREFGFPDVYRSARCLSDAPAQLLSRAVTPAAPAVGWRSTRVCCQCSP